MNWAHFGPAHEPGSKMRKSKRETEETRKRIVEMAADEFRPRLLVFSPAGFENFIDATAVTAPEGAPAPTEPPPVAVQNVMELAASYGIHFE